MNERPELRTTGAGSAVVGNERTTALASAVLLPLIVGALLTAARTRVLLSAHIVVGVVLVGPLAVKIGSTGYRFVRYYRGSAPFVAKGPPLPVLRVLAPLLLAATLALIASGIALDVTGPDHGGPLIPLHNVTAMIWLPMIAIHVFAHLRSVPSRIVDDWRRQPAEPASGRGRRLTLILGALVGGTIATTLTVPLNTAWIDWTKTNAAGPPAPLLAGTLATTLVLLPRRVRAALVSGPDTDRGDTQDRSSSPGPPETPP